MSPFWRLQFGDGFYICGKLLDTSPKGRHRLESCTTYTISLNSGLKFSYIFVRLPHGCIPKGFSIKILHQYLVSLHLLLCPVYLISLDITVLTALGLGKHIRSSNSSADGQFRNFSWAGSCKSCFLSPKHSGRLWDPSRGCFPLGKAAEP